MTNEEFQNVCLAEFKEVHGKLDSLDDALRGTNGTKGLNSRLGALERCVASRKKFDWMALTAIVGLAFTLCAKWILGSVKIG